jgi:DNA-binding transcriptional LysR family regulator
MSEDLNAMAVFAAVAEAHGFRPAAERLGVSASAVSQTLRKLEAQLGVVLLQRTSRSVRLTEAGERLYAAARPALAELRAAVADLGNMGGAPRGTLRIYAADAAESFLNGPLLAAFLAAHPHVDLDVAVSAAPVEIVSAGYDAGIQLGEVIDRDMIAIPVSGDLRLVVVASPSYLKRRGRPQHPRDLADHDVINWHATPEVPPYRWEFTEPGPNVGDEHGGREFAITVRSRVLTTDTALMLGLVRAGAGITMLWEGLVREDVARGDLIPVLEEFSTAFPGFYLYYPQRRQASPALRALIDHLRAANASRKRSGGGRS